MAWYNPFSWGKQDADPTKAVLQNRDFLTQQIQQGLAGVQGRPAPQADRTVVGPVRTGNAAQIATGPQDQFRAMQLDAAQRQAAIARGETAGAGELATQRQVQRGLAAQGAQARGVRGPNAGMAALAGARNSVDIAGAGVGQAQQAALQDQANAQAQLNSMLGTGRGQDIGLATSQAQLGQEMNLANLNAQNQQIFQQAGLDQATSLANMQARLQAMGMNDQAALAYIAQLYGMDAAEMQARIQQEGNSMGQQGVFGDILAAGGTALTSPLLSDRKLKTGIRRAELDLDDMMAKLKPYAYRYKDERHGAGERPGIMAQDLERSAAGRQLVREVPGVGKGVDVQAAVGAALAAAARLDERLRRVEGGR